MSVLYQQSGWLVQQVEIEFIHISTWFHVTALTDSPSSASSRNDTGMSAMEVGSGSVN